MPRKTRRNAKKKSEGQQAFQSERKLRSSSRDQPQNDGAVRPAPDAVLTSNVDEEVSSRGSRVGETASGRDSNSSVGVTVQPVSALTPEEPVGGGQEPPKSSLLGKRQMSHKGDSDQSSDPEDKVDVLERRRVRHGD